MPFRGSAKKGDRQLTARVRMRGHVAILSKIGEGLTDKVTFEQTLEGDQRKQF